MDGVVKEGEAVFCDKPRDDRQYDDMPYDNNNVHGSNDHDNDVCTGDEQVVIVDVAG
jgi:hypothetical protein